MPKSAKLFRRSLQKSGVFFTPKKLAEYMRSFFPSDVAEIYDPTCGDGGLLAEFDGAKKYGQEIDAEQGNYAATNLVNAEIEIGDTLDDDKFKDRKFRYIVANPPFSVAWEPQMDERFEGFGLAPKSKADYAFILHCLHHLEEGGLAVVMCFPGVLYRGQREGEIRERIVRDNLIERVVEIPGGDFEDTSISTVLLIFRKNRQTNSVVFEKKETGETREVNLDEIEKNGFNLSVCQYIEPKSDKAKIDPLKEQVAARAAALNHLRASIRVDATVCELERFRQPEFDHVDFLNRLQKIIAEEKAAFLKKWKERLDPTRVQMELFGL